MSDSLQQQLDQAMAEFEQQRQALVKAKEEIAAIQVTVRSADRSVEVTMGADGGPTGLRFLDDKHKAMSGQKLASSVLEAMGLARQELNVRVRARFDEAAATATGARPGATAAGAGSAAAAGTGQETRTMPGGRLERMDGLGLDRLLDSLRAPGGPLAPAKSERSADRG